MGQDNSKMDKSEATAFVQKEIAENCVVIFSKSHCPYCRMAKNVMNETGKPHKVLELDRMEGTSTIQDVLQELTGARTVPRVFVNGQCIGGGTETKQLHKDGQLVPLIEKCQSS